mgnify:CR=1 FL=1
MMVGVLVGIAWIKNGDFHWLALYSSDKSTKYQAMFQSNC